MKTLYFISLCLLFVVVSVQAQVSSAFTRLYTSDQGGTYKVEAQFTADSTGQFMSDVFYPGPAFDGVDFSTYPVTFALKCVSTAGISNKEVFILGVYQGKSDTTALDTVSEFAVNQRETDTTGVLTFNKKVAAGYRIFIRNKTNDINSGVLTLIWPRAEAWYTPLKATPRK